MLKKLTPIHLAVMLGILGTASCADHPLLDKTVTITGLVTDGAYPLIDVDVVVETSSGPWRARTDTGGTYGVRVAKGEVTLRVEVGGFIPQVKRYNVTQDERVDFVLERLHGSDSVPGLYTLTFTASPSCTFPAEAMHRTYIARIQEGHELNRGEDLIVTVTGADFMGGFVSEAGFTGWRDGMMVHFDITDNGDASLALIERLPDGTELYYSGKASGTVSDPTIVATFSGRLRLENLDCQADDHRMEFVR